jgi:hypothetical protein
MTPGVTARGAGGPTAQVDGTTVAISEQDEVALIADYLIGEIDMGQGWLMLNKAFSRAYRLAVSVALPQGSNSADQPVGRADRALRVRDAIAQRWRDAAVAHSDPDAAPSGLAPAPVP